MSALGMFTHTVGTFQDFAGCIIGAKIAAKSSPPPANVRPRVIGVCPQSPMKRNAREFIRSTTTLLDHILATLTPGEQHDLLDALAGEVEERLDALVETAES
jgi:hypothetical protein